MGTPYNFSSSNPQGSQGGQPSFGNPKVRTIPDTTPVVSFKQMQTGNVKTGTKSVYAPKMQMQTSSDASTPKEIAPPTSNKSSLTIIKLVERPNSSMSAQKIKEIEIFCQICFEALNIGLGYGVCIECKGTGTMLFPDSSCGYTINELTLMAALELNQIIADISTSPPKEKEHTQDDIRIADGDDSEGSVVSSISNADTETISRSEPAIVEDDLMAKSIKVDFIELIEPIDPVNPSSVSSSTPPVVSEMTTTEPVLVEEPKQPEFTHLSESVRVIFPNSGEGELISEKTGGLMRIIYDILGGKQQDVPEKLNEGVQWMLRHMKNVDSTSRDALKARMIFETTRNSKNSRKSTLVEVEDENFLTIPVAMYTVQERRFLSMLHGNVIRIVIDSLGLTVDVNTPDNMIVQDGKVLVKLAAAPSFANSALEFNPETKQIDISAAVDSALYSFDEKTNLEFICARDMSTSPITYTFPIDKLTELGNALAEVAKTGAYQSKGGSEVIDYSVRSGNNTSMWVLNSRQLFLRSDQFLSTHMISDIAKHTIVECVHDGEKIIYTTCRPNVVLLASYIAL